MSVHDFRVSVKKVLYSSIFGKVLWFDNESEFGCIQYFMNGRKEEINVNRYGVINRELLKVGNYVKFDIVLLDKFNSREEAFDVTVVSARSYERNKLMRSNMPNNDVDCLRSEFEKESGRIEAEKLRLRMEAEYIAKEKSRLIYGRHHHHNQHYHNAVAASQPSTSVFVHKRLPHYNNDSSDNYSSTPSARQQVQKKENSSSYMKNAASNSHTTDGVPIQNCGLSVSFPKSADLRMCLGNLSQQDDCITFLPTEKSFTSNLKRKPDLRSQIEISKRLRQQDFVRYSEILRQYDERF